MNLGSADPLDLNYLKELKSLIQQIEPERVSDHLCWTGLRGRNSHDLLPLPYVEEVVNHVSEKILRVQDYLGRQLTIENVSAYVKWEASKMSEGEFLSAIIKRTGCGFLLDLNNIYVTSKNLGESASKFISEIPVHSVTQIHLAGPSEGEDGFLIDTHDSEVREEVWALLEEWSQIEKKAGKNVTPVMIERDGDIPEWEVLERELLRILEVIKGGYEYV